MPRPDPAVRDRMAGEQLQRTTPARGVRFEVDVLPGLAVPWLCGWPQKVTVIAQEFLTDPRGTR